MKFIESYSKANMSKDSEKSFYDRSGSVVEESVDKIFAQVIDVDLGGNQRQKKFFIRTYNNLPFDPLGPDSRREIWTRTLLKVVSQSTFDYYIMYLKSNNSLYMTRTQRSFING